MSSTYSVIPDEVLQDTTRRTCWAATCESWLSRIPQHPANTIGGLTQSDLIAMYSKYTDPQDGLDIKRGFPEFAVDMQMTIDAFLDAKQITGAYLYAKLKKYKYLYMFFAGGQTGLGNGMAHASVIYGIGNAFNQNCTLGVMDPWDRGIVPMQPLANYRKAKEALIGWYPY